MLYPSIHPSVCGLFYPLHEIEANIEFNGLADLIPVTHTLDGLWLYNLLFFVPPAPPPGVLLARIS